MPPKKKKDESEEEEDYFPEKLLDFKEDKKGKQTFLVKWKGYPASENTWEPAENLADQCQEMMDEMMAKALAKEESGARSRSGAAAEKDAEKKKSEKVKLGAGAQGTRAMTTKPTRTLPKRESSTPPPGPEPKKAKSEPKKEKLPKEISEEDLEAIANALMKEMHSKKNQGDDEEAEMVEVEAIIGMRARKKGVQYKIQWKSGDTSWEPYDNVMDDDLIDDFEEKLQIEVRTTQPHIAACNILTLIPSLPTHTGVRRRHYGRGRRHRGQECRRGL